jgi:hypothetical protein
LSGVALLLVLESHGKLLREFVHNKFLFLLQRVLCVDLLLLQFLKPSLQIAVEVFFLDLHPPGKTFFLPLQIN